MNCIPWLGLPGGHCDNRSPPGLSGLVAFEDLEGGGPFIFLLAIHFSSIRAQILTPRLLFWFKIFRRMHETACDFQSRISD